jgi:hypothetical protein
MDGFFVCKAMGENPPFDRKIIGRQTLDNQIVLFSLLFATFYSE